MICSNGSIPTLQNNHWRLVTWFGKEVTLKIQSSKFPFWSVFFIDFLHLFSFIGCFFTPLTFLWFFLFQILWKWFRRCWSQSVWIRSDEVKMGWHSPTSRLISWRWRRLREKHNVFFLLKGTLQGTNISPKNGILKMIFLFPRWDMLIPWRVTRFNLIYARWWL